ncbi:MAG: DUF2520 domain-containing protein [Solirubrobacterales bacterium]
MRELERHFPDASDLLAPLCLVGRGRMGSSLARAAETAGLQVVTAGRGEVVSRAANCRVALLCVPDRAIGEACRELASADPVPAAVGHVSGAGSLSLLDAATARGAETFSVHPLQTVPDGHASVAGAACAIAGSSESARRLAESLARTLGMRPFTVPEEHRGAYHAAAATASNLLLALEESAAELLKAAGVDEDPRALLGPLVLRSAENWIARGPDALTGPIARGDQPTVDAHRAAIAKLAPHLQPLYDVLADRAREIASRTGTAPLPDVPVAAR